MTKIVCLISAIGLAACSSTPPSPQSRPTTEEKLGRELGAPRTAPSTM